VSSLKESMKQEVIQDFLNLPGIAGIALMDGRTRPYFCGIDQNLNFQQKEALAQGILQVVETIPEGFEAFEFKFTDYQIYIYKLKHGIILLVLTRNNLTDANYLPTVKKLKTALLEDSGNTIATFRLVAGNITLSGLSHRKHTEASLSPKSKTDNLAIHSQSDQKPEFAANHADHPNSTRGNHTLPETKSVSYESAAIPSPQLDDPTSTSLETTLSEFVAALNHLSQFTTQYLGTAVIVNYWKSTRPNADWFNNFQIERSAQIICSGLPPDHPLTPQEQQWLQEWVKAFIKRCSQVIRDFPILIDQAAIDKRQKTLLLG
jgi:hypothetical protein